jgi:hypothetical protein
MTPFLLVDVDVIGMVSTGVQLCRSGSAVWDSPLKTRDYVALSSYGAHSRRDVLDRHIDNAVN